MFLPQLGGFRLLYSVAVVLSGKVALQGTHPIALNASAPSRTRTESPVRRPQP